MISESLIPTIADLPTANAALLSKGEVSSQSKDIIVCTAGLNISNPCLPAIAGTPCSSRALINKGTLA